MISRREEKRLPDVDLDEKLAVAEDELIEDYPDGRLSERERKHFIEHFLTSPERKKALRMIQNSRKYAARAKAETAEKRAATEKSSPFVRRALSSAPFFRLAAVLLIGLAALGVWRFAFARPETEKGLELLRLAHRGQRSIEARTSAKLEYAPFLNLRGKESGLVDQKARSRALVILVAAAENSADAQAHQALGLFHLAEREIEPALHELNLALQLSPHDARLNGDLGAAYLEKAAQAEQEKKYDEILENLSLALRYGNRSLEIDGSSPEALFNRALTLQKMRLPQQAQAAWEKYLQVEGAAGWSEEAEKNLESLRKQILQTKDKALVLRDFLEAYRTGDDQRAWEIASQTKELITDVMIAPQLAKRFLEASRQNLPAEADEALGAFLYLGELEKKNAADPYFSEAAVFYRNSAHNQRENSSQAYLNLEEGYTAARQSDFGRALAAMRRAEKLFAAAGNYWEAQIARFQISYCLTQLGQIGESNQLLLEMLDESEKKGHRWLQTLISGWLGSNYSLLGEHSKAISYNRRSLAAAETISDVYNIQKAFNQLAHEYWLIGDLRGALESVYRSLNARNSYFLSPRQQNRNLIFATESLYRFKFYESAAVFASEEELVARLNNDKFLSHTAHNHLAMIRGKEQKYEAAFQEIEASFQISDSFEDASMRERQRARNYLIQAHLQREAGNCGESLASYAEVIRSYENTEFSINNYAARKGRLMCLAALGDDEGLGRELAVVLGMFDENRQKIAAESERNIFFDNEQSVYDIAVEHAYTRLKNPEAAFNYAENSRARSLLGLVGEKHGRPLLLSELRPQIPARAQMVYYAVLADKTLIWQISADQIVTAEARVGAAELTGKVQKYRDLLISRSNPEEVARLAGELYELLIGPIESTLAPDRALSIVADKILFRLPFAALVSPRTGKYLIEDYALQYAPSATVFISESEIAGRKAQIGTETILSVGNPSFSKKEFPELSDLPDAVREAKEIAALYETAEILTGERAVKERVVKSLRETDVLHFAGHYVAHDKSPELSKFLLSSSALSVGEITPEKLSRTRLIILSACETGVEGFLSGEGMIGAARAFLAAEVPLVVASGWPVDSAASAELMIKFHEYRKKQNLPTMAALRRAQIDLLSEKKSRFHEPFYWAGFMTIGGYAEY